jgi:hypothetical protein
MNEPERLRAFAESCLAAARSISLQADAKRLKAMAAEALEQAKHLEIIASQPPPRSSQPVAQQQQQPQPQKKEDDA